MEKKTSQTLTAILTVAGLAALLLGAKPSKKNITRSYMGPIMEEFYLYSNPNELDPTDFESPCDQYREGTDMYYECSTGVPLYLPQDFDPETPL